MTGVRWDVVESNQVRLYLKGTANVCSMHLLFALLYGTPVTPCRSLSTETGGIPVPETAAVMLGYTLSRDGPFDAVGNVDRDALGSLLFLVDELRTYLKLSVATNTIRDKRNQFRSTLGSEVLTGACVADNTDDPGFGESSRSKSTR